MRADGGERPYRLGNQPALNSFRHAAILRRLPTPLATLPGAQSHISKIITSDSNKCKSECKPSLCTKQLLGQWTSMSQEQRHDQILGL